MPHSIPPLFALPHPGAVNPAPVPIDASTREALAQWIARAPDAAELAGRNEAVSRIITCAELCSSSLNLCGLSLSELPEVVFDLGWLASLRLADNRLNDIPAALTQLECLHLLDLRNNQLHGVGANLLQLNPHCTVVLTGNPLPFEVRAHWQQPATRLDAPTLIFDRPGIDTFAQTAASPPRRRPMVESILINRIRHEVIWVRSLRDRGFDSGVLFIGGILPQTRTPLSEAIELWRIQAAGYGALLPRLRPEQAEQLNQAAHADSFATWLLRLSETADYHRGASERTLLNGRISTLLSAIIEHPSLREVCFQIAQDALESCGDRVALALNQMELAHLNHRAEQGALDGPALFALGRQLYRMQALEKISQREARRLQREHEAIEVFLAFQVGLRERLDLPVGNRTMLYRASSHVEDKDLEEAAVEIESAERLPAAPLLARLAALDDATEAAKLMLEVPPVHPLARFLAQFPPWQQWVERQHAPEQTRLTEAMYDCLEVLALQLGEGKINEAQYREAMDQTMFFANSGLAYRKALESIAADQRA